MQTSIDGLIELVGHEGVCLSKYKDSVGVWTIGIGATKTEIPDLDSWPSTKRITVVEAFNLLKRSIKRYEKAVNDAVDGYVSQTQFDALVSWCYNVGTGHCYPKYNSKGVKSKDEATVLKLIKAGATKYELYNALMMWTKAGGKYSPGVAARRKKEAILLRDGIYSNKGKAALFPVSSTGHPIYSQAITIDVENFLVEDIQVDGPTIPVAEPVAEPVKVGMFAKAMETLGNLWGKKA